MTATKPRPKMVSNGEAEAPSYDIVREAAFSLPAAAQTKLIYDLLNQVVPQRVQPKTNGASVTDEDSVEQQVHEGNILDIVGRWDFAYDIEDDEIKQIIGEARMKKYAPELLPEMRAQWKSDRLTRKRLDEQTRLAREMGLLEDEEEEEE